VLLNVEKPDQVFVLPGCFHVEQLSPKGTFALTQAPDSGHLAIAQMPGGEVIRVLPIDGQGFWSPDGRRLFITSRDQGTTVLVYDLELEQLTTVEEYPRDVYFMGWSPASEWAVYSHVGDPNRIPVEGLGTVFAVSGNGRSVRELYGIFSGDYELEFVQAWLSESTYVSARSVEWFNVELRKVNIVSLEVEVLLGNNLGVMVEGTSATVFFVIPSQEIGTFALDPGVYRMTAAGGWRPQLVMAPADPSTWSPPRLRWIPELRRVSLCETGDADPERSRTLLDLSGQVRLQLDCRQFLVPSPDGRYLFLFDPEGARLLDPEGEEIRDLGPISVKRALWNPPSRGLFYTGSDGNLYGAFPEDDWRPRELRSDMDVDTELHFLIRPERPFVEHCLDAPPSRLKVGDQARVSLDPPTPSRIRSEPSSAQGRVVGSVGPGARVSVFDGPECAEGFVWWRVRPLGQSVEGWLAEGVWSGAWLIPEES
jgi:hypothetical protein